MEKQKIIIFQANLRTILVFVDRHLPRLGLRWRSLVIFYMIVCIDTLWS